MMSKSPPPLMAPWSSSKFVTSQSMVGDRDDSDGKTEGFSDGERLGS
jgi:hypothetical protein